MNTFGKYNLEEFIPNNLAFHNYDYIQFVFLTSNYSIASGEYRISFRHFPNSIFFLLYGDLQTKYMLEESLDYLTQFTDVLPVEIKLVNYLEYYLWMYKLIQQPRWSEYMDTKKIIINGNTMPLMILMGIRDAIMSFNLKGLIITGTYPNFEKIPIGKIDSSMSNLSIKILDIITHEIKIRGLEYIPLNDLVSIIEEDIPTNTRRLLNYHLNPLIKANFIELRENPDDKRERLIFLLPK